MTLDLELKKRKSHFQWVANSLRRNKQDFYLEKDWYDTPTLVSLSDAEKEVRQAEEELELI